MSGFSVSGTSSSTAGQLGAGIDIASTVSSLMQVQRLPEQQMQAQQTLLNSQSQALQSLINNLSDLQTKVQTLTDFTGQLAARTATTSDSTLLTAAADSTASLGQHQIVINNLALTSAVYTDVVTGSTVSTGSFSIKVGSKTAVPITITSSNNTLSGIAQAINAANAGVTASVITDSAGSRLSILSSTSGVAGDITISGNTTGLTFNKAVTGKDASLQVDGIPIDSASNTVQNIIPGVTLNLVGANPNSTVTLGVTPNVTQATSAIQGFVNSYNTIVQAINAQYKYIPGASGSTPPLLGDTSLDIVQQQLYTSITYSITNNSGVNSLSDLGITVNNDGTLSVDSSKLSSALTSNNAAVQNFFQLAGTGFAQQFNATLGTMTDPVKGAFNVDLKGITASISAVQSQISDFEVRMATIQQRLTAQYNSVNTTLQQMPLLLAQINNQLNSLG